MSNLLGIRAFARDPESIPLPAGIGRVTAGILIIGMTKKALVTVLIWLEYRMPLQMTDGLLFLPKEV
jgi:hypothetical protein